MARVRRRRDDGERLIVVAFGIDRFDEVSDVHGRIVGDTMLAEVARRLRRTVPPRALLARANDADLLLALRVDAATTVRQAIGEIRLEAACAPITVAGVYHLVALSAGVACLRPGESTASLVARAERALAARARDAVEAVHLAP